MTETKKGSRKKKAAVSPPQPAQVTPSITQWADRIVLILSKFNRYGWDFLGTLLIAAGLLSLAALLGLTQGTLIHPLSNLMRSWFGWGSFMIPAAFIAAGYLAFKQVGPSRTIVPLLKILEWEGAGLTLLAILTIAGGGGLARAANGFDGGLVGWGLAELPIEFGLPPLARTILICLLFFIFLTSGLGVYAWLARWAESVLAESTPQAEPDTSLHSVFLDDIQSDEPVEPIELQEKVNNGNLKSTALPPEFKKDFHIQNKLDETSPVLPPRDERLPPLNLLTAEQNVRPDERHINSTAGLLEKALAEFGVPAKVVGFRVGPTVTQFAVEPGYTEKPGPDGTTIQQKVRVSQISTLSRDLALALSAERLRIEAPVPGRSYVGIEVPNSHSSIVRLRPILETDAFYKTNSPLSIALGRDVSGHPVVADLTRMPHLLIAGTTGSGKSVCIAALTACLVMNNTPADLRIAMIDPKMVELVRFNGLPHLMGKVETELERILGVLRWAISEMEQRYRLLESVHARDLDAYNRKMEKRKAATLPRIVIIIDELADLMMSEPDQTEHSLVRLAQMARATGIHLVVATQRPSTDVVTGLIKANFPARIAFTVASSIDSRVILDTSGAETLLGRGDLLFLNPEVGSPQRAQGVMITDQEIEKIITFWQKMSPAEPNQASPWEQILSEDENSPDTLVDQAVSVVRSTQRASASLLQRKLRIGYPRAARLIDELEELGIVGPSQGGGREREVLVERDDDEEDMDDGDTGEE
jgi:DNA segregation ATPase FtsK/SpoIIIE, S-DNA-T family